MSGMYAMNAGGTADCIGAAGCREGLCLSCRASLVRLPVARYYFDADGVPDAEKIPVRGNVCGLLTAPSQKSPSGAAGCTGDAMLGDRRSLTVAASSIGRLKTGDRVGVCGEQWRVAAVEGGSMSYTARLLPEWEEASQWG